MMTHYYSLQALFLHTKSITYILMGLGLLCLLGFYIFLTGRDDK